MKYKCMYCGAVVDYPENYVGDMFCQCGSYFFAPVDANYFQFQEIYHDTKTKERILLKDIEQELDELNGREGNKDRLCLFCFSKEYNEKEGIVHSENCLIRRLRELK